MRTTRRWLSIMGTMFILCFAPGCVICLGPTSRYEADPKENTVDFAGCSRFAAKIRNGSITVEGWDQPEVKMTARVWARAYSLHAARKLVEATTVELKRRGDEVVVHYQPAIGVGLANNEQVGVNLVVRLPSKASVTASSSMGDLASAQLAGNINLHTAHGQITLADTTGPVECETSFGDVILEGAQGPINCKTSHGDIKITRAAAAVDCQTSFGDIILTDPQGVVKACTSHGDIKASVGPGYWRGGQMQLETSFGDVRVSVKTKPDSL